MRVRRLHNVFVWPKDTVSVEIQRRIEPKINPLLSISFAMSKYVCLHRVRLATSVSQELKI